MNMRNAQDLLKGLTPRYDLLILALLLTTSAVLLGAVGWGFSLRALHQDIPWVSMISIHLGSNLAKYLPGYAWQLAGKAYLTSHGGVKPKVVASAMILEMSQLMLLGSGLSLVMLPQAMINTWLSQGYSDLTRVFCRILGVLLLVITPILLTSIFEKTSSRIGIPGVRRSAVLASSGAILIGWITFSLAYYLMGKALLDLMAGHFAGFVFTLTASFLIGLLIVIVPGSLGVRESLMVYFLSLIQIPSAMAALIAVLSRLMVTLSEISSYLIYRYVTRN